MTTVNQKIRDEALRSAISRERYSDELVRQILQILRRSEVDLEQQIAARVAKLGPIGQQARGRATTERLVDFLRQTREINDAGYVDLGKRLESELFGRAQSEAVGAKREIATAISAVGVQLDLHTPPLPVLEALVKDRPFDGRLLSEWVERTRDNRWAGIRDAVERTVGVGLAQGETVDQMARRLQGAFELSRREATSLVRTSVAHVAAGSREAMYEANSDIVRAIAWVSTLDTRTTGACKLRDGKLYDLKTKEPIGHSLPWNGGPGRLHWQCRSTSVPVLGTWEDLGLDGSKIGPGARAAMDGEAAGNEDYEVWLRRQPLEIKKAALGDLRGQLFHQDPSLPLEAVLKLSGAQLRATARPTPVTIVSGLERTFDEIQAEIGKAADAYEKRRIQLEGEVDRMRLRFEQIAFETSSEAREEARSLRAKLYDAGRSLTGLAEQARSEFAKIVAGDLGPTKLAVAYATRAAKDRSAAVNRATDWLSKVWRRFTPETALPVHATRRHRAYYALDGISRDPTGIYLPADVLTKTVVHEIGHWLEALDPKLHQSLLDWLDERTAGEALVWLGSGNEFARPDKFIQAYVGKEYSLHGNRFATEVLSMGLQYLYEDPWEFRRRDPDMFDFIVRLALGVK